MEEIGDVPKLALVIRLTPKELTNNPMKKIRERCIFFPTTKQHPLLQG